MLDGVLATKAVVGRYEVQQLDSLGAAEESKVEFPQRLFRIYT